MKKALKNLMFAFALSLTLQITGTKVHAAQGDDKHVMASGAITVASYGALKGRTKYPILYSIGIATLAGVAKEASDPEFSESDMKFNAIGIGLGLLPVMFWEF